MAEAVGAAVAACGGGAVELQERLCGEGGVGRVGGEWPRVSTSAGREAVRRGGSVRARAKRALWARPERARYVLDRMPGWARVLERGWQLTGLC